MLALHTVVGTLRADYEEFYGRQNVTQFLAQRLAYQETSFEQYYHIGNAATRLIRLAAGTGWLPGIPREIDPQWQLSHRRFDALGPPFPCPHLHTFGKGDSEKRVCLPKTFRSEGRCNIISVGGANRWDFEVSIVRRLPRCHVHTLDCASRDSNLAGHNPCPAQSMLTLEAPEWARISLMTGTVVGTVPPEIARSVNFHKVCLGARDEVVGDKRFLTWPSMLREIGLHSAPAVLKMDIEGFEWSVLPDLVQVPHLLPESISLELHYRTQMRELP